MIRNIRWSIHAACALALVPLCSCGPAPTYTPGQSSGQTKTTGQEISDGDALKIVQGMASSARLLTPNGGNPDPDLVNKTYDFTGAREIQPNTVYSIASVRITSKALNITLAGGKTVEFLLIALRPRATCSASNCIIYPGNISSDLLLSPDTNAAQRLTDALFKLRQAVSSNRAPTGDDASFSEIARNYQGSNPKPSLPEDAHRFAVQAEGAVHDKDFDGAADFYQQALAIAPWWPEGHFNRALVLAANDEFSYAIVEMKRYMTLVPNATDARAAQDKIYDWERKAPPAK